MGRTEQINQVHQHLQTKQARNLHDASGGAAPPGPNGHAHSQAAGLSEGHQRRVCCLENFWESRAVTVEVIVSSPAVLSRMPGSPLTAFHHNRGAERKPLPFLLLLTVSPLLSFSSLQVLPLNIKFISTVTNHKAFICTEAEVRSPIPRPHHTKRDDNLLIQPRATLG